MLVEPHRQAQSDLLRHRLRHAPLNRLIIQILGEILRVENVEPVDQPLTAGRQRSLLAVAAEQSPARLPDQPDARGLGEVEYALRLARDPEVHVEVETPRRAAFGAEAPEQRLAQNL